MSSTVDSDLCQVFLRQPPGAYKPLVCKEIIADTRSIKGTGQVNRLDFFFLLKPNTLREYATLDLVYPHPSWLQSAVQSSGKMQFVRLTTGGFTRITTNSFIRVTA